MSDEPPSPSAPKVANGTQGSRPRSLLENLRRANLRANLGGFGIHPMPLADERETRIAARFAARLATSESPENQQTAFELAARSTSLNGSDPVVRISAALAFVRTGQFHAYNHLLHQHPEWTPDWPFGIAIELAGRLAENVPVTGIDGDILTDFQRDLAYTLLTRDEVSIAAPTSTGKSYAFLNAVRELVANERATVMYMVPTKALIREVQAKVRKALRPDIRVPIRSVPIPLKPGQGANGAVWVLTQERVLALMNSKESPAAPDVLFVDEAQGVADDERGVTLETAIEACRRRAHQEGKRFRIYFAAPTIDNPGDLIGFGGLKRGGVAHKETRTSVIHNHYRVRTKHEGRGKTRQHWLEIEAFQGDSTPIKVELDGPPPTKSTVKAWLAQRVHQPHSTTVVFCNAKAETETQAHNLVAGLVSAPEPNERLSALVTYIKKNVHPMHPLLDLLPFRVAVHYRPLPTLVKHRIEELAAEGALDYIFCTSTLLQGVNIPCRNIVLDNPCNNTTPLSVPQVLNLAGRSGRMRHDVIGNVWMFNPDEWKVPGGETSPAPAVLGPRPITPAFKAALRAGGVLEPQRLPDETTRKPLPPMVIGRAFQIVSRGDNLQSYGESDSAKAELATIEASFREFKESRQVPLEILERHTGFDPRRLDKLYKHLLKVHEENPAELEAYVLVPRRLEDSGKLFAFFLDKLGNVSKKIAPDHHDAVHKKRCVIAKEWVGSHSLKFILNAAIAYYSNPKRMTDRIDASDPAQVAGCIRDTLECLEQEVRYEMVRHARVLNDMLAHIYEEVLEQPETVREMQDLPILLEFGTKNKRTLMLLSAGFTRGPAREISAILKQVHPTEFDSEEDLVAWLTSPESNVKTWKISPEAWLELCVVTGRDPGEIDWSAEYEPEPDGD